MTFLKQVFPSLVVVERTFYRQDISIAKTFHSQDIFTAKTFS